MDPLYLAFPHNPCNRGYKRPTASMFITSNGTTGVVVGEIFLDD
jgi:hypothetical protein